MKLAEVKNHLNNLKTISFQLPDGELIPGHFHVTEVGKVSKHFIDCGGVIRKEQVVNFQLWNADDYDHRLHPEKLIQIIKLSEDKLNIDEELTVEVEYQGRSIETFTLDFDGSNFLLLNKQTDCLAKDQCGVPAEKPKVKMAELNATTCTPGGGCC
ncbi:hypothetical protein DSM03_11357 [Leeuwenhoekiella aestuarii]|uniref:Uncharacterized protein n=1 Tax=Leeuwenhoekiella aestuarii TaxID=2249426 RepID=A0A4Q0NQ08_9FLAO|nr:DUF6428 family protein [Leeuwenhoekiella aestuarii]RXG11326.1 hypothetical protein DSM04_11257 [Leeuwenhoekiella aestuarii]RXG11864.1 hypothetical protein DSM03_11357 [Leeuwenhoekiella aestuarii]